MRIQNVVVLLLFAAKCFAQSPAIIKNIDQYQGIKDISPSNIWFGSQLVYNFSSEGEFEDKLGFTGNVILNTFDWNQSPRVHFPIIGNISQIKVGETDTSVKANAQKLLNSFHGINVGFYPYVLWGDTKSWSATVWGTFAYKLNSIKDTSQSTVRLSHIRYGVGIELSIGGAKLSKLPPVLSINFIGTAITSTKAYAKAFTNDKKKWFGTEFTFILPTVNNIGLLGKAQFSKGISPIWNGGLVFSQGIK